MKAKPLFAVALLGLLGAVGCGGPALPDTSPATGVVTFRGEPVEGATVIFSRGARDMANGEVAIAKTDAQGRFELTTHVGSQADVKGAVPGEYEVTVSKHVPPPGMSQAEYQAKVDAANKIGEAGGMVPPDKQPPPLVEMLPKQYSAPGQTTLTATVTEEGPNDFQFELK